MLCARGSPAVEGQEHTHIPANINYGCTLESPGTPVIKAAWDWGFGGRGWAAQRHLLGLSGGMIGSQLMSE